MWFHLLTLNLTFCTLVTVLLEFSCYSWVEVHREELTKMNSSLEFKLHRLKFVTLLDSGMLQEALQYSKLFGQFANKHKKGMCLSVCPSVCLPVCVSVCGCICVSVPTSVCLYPRLRVSVCVCLCVYVSVYHCVCTCTCMT